MDYQQTCLSDTDGNCMSNRFEKFCKKLNIEHAALSLYHHQSNSQKEVCIKFIKQTIKNCSNTNSDRHIALLEIRTTPLRSGLPSPATLQLNAQQGYNTNSK